MMTSFIDCIYVFDDTQELQMLTSGDEVTETP